MLLIFTSAKNRLYLLINSPDINVFLKIHYLIIYEEKIKKVNAAILIIGNEILSGRTQDKNISFICNWLNDNCGITVLEVRIIPDVEKTIVENVKNYQKNLIMYLQQEVSDQLMTISLLNQSQRLLKKNTNFTMRLTKF